MSWGAVTVLSGLALLAGCAAMPPAPSEQPTYAQGFADGQAALRRDLRYNPSLRVSYWEVGPCDPSPRRLPVNAINISRYQYLQALRAEQAQHRKCAARHDDLRARVKTILGVIRHG